MTNIEQEAEIKFLESVIDDIDTAGYGEGYSFNMHILSNKVRKRVAFIAGANWAQENRWIDVKEKQPEWNELVIAAGKFGNEIGVLANTVYRLMSGKFYNQLSGEPLDIEITHWMELPKAPK